MLKLDHLTVIAPSLAEGAAHVRDCLGLDVPFGTRHLYMGTHNHRLQLGGNVYLEIVALDPEGIDPGRARWFGVDDTQRVRADWDRGRRLRGWVANGEGICAVLAARPGLFGDEVSLPPAIPSFGFTIPADGSLPLDGAAPSIIDHRGDPTSMAEIPDLGARLVSFTLEHPNPSAIGQLYREIGVVDPPEIIRGPELRYRARIRTPEGVKELT
ncbi:VOC family protein [Rhodobacteraceae bacterium NNCM2]|nr:VOC family protein [Coraliihabitans acroporae]